MRIELWSIYFSPVSLGVGPLAGTLADELARRGHEVTVVTSHPHYPTPEWGVSWRKRRRSAGPVEVHELPVYVRRSTALQRAGEEATYAARQTAWALKPTRPDVVLATVPSLMCLPGAMLRKRLYGTPFVIWLQDIISTGAASTGLSGGSRLASALEAIERRAFRDADQTVVISEAFESWLEGIGVPEERIARIGLATRREIRAVRAEPPATPVALVIGNVGLSQGLPALVEAFQRSPELAAIGAELRIAGGGVELERTLAAIDSDRVRYLGLFSEEELEPILAEASVGLVTQTPEIVEFNLPSKVLTYMTSGLPVVSITNPDSEISRLVAASGGRAIANGDLDAACAELAVALADRAALAAASEQALAFARENFDPAAMGARFEQVLERAVAGSAGR